MEGKAETHCLPPPRETRLGEPEKQKAMGGAALQVCPLQARPFALLLGEHSYLEFTDGETAPARPRTLLEQGHPGGSGLPCRSVRSMRPFSKILLGAWSNRLMIMTSYSILEHLPYIRHCPGHFHTHYPVSSS